jgi:hypothetical protein
MTRVNLCEDCLSLAGHNPAGAGFVAAEGDVTCWHCGKVRKCYPFTREAGKVPGIYVFKYAKGLPLPLLDFDKEE